ncbi:MULTISPECIES: beta strand repeat-containing protein [Thiorhodovibrio]|uniref:beta strand repeat-containing protein n=1 Tax=Thiorhodovibrio TaxID=61593 RepID=UPI0019136A15|nr:MULTISPECIES: calcium-binding protein [Thiorhodovibrio]MBK5969512.1 hypothetical protein [Thiorhodovibrio winogradskyi]WPL15044.1 Poly(beta-D-mannuronate) C5 epimerase 7 [Thiorhodovibrio litoralis]
MTTAIESIDGTSGDDTFNGVIEANAAAGATFNTGDSLDGKAGTDTFKLTAATNDTPIGTLASIENIQIQNLVAGPTGDLNAVNWTGVEKITAMNSGSDSQTAMVEVSNLQNNVTAGLDNVKVAVGGNDALEFTFADGKIGSTDATLNIETASSGTSTKRADIKVTTGGSDKFTTFAVNATGGESYIGLASVAGDTDPKTLTFSGAGKVDFAASTNVAFTNVTSVNASANSGGVTVDVSASTKDATITGGTGNDTLTVNLNKAISVNGGDGDDVIGIGNAALGDLTTADTLNGGGGNNILAMTAAAGDALDGASSTNLAQITNFQGVRINDDLNNTTIDISKFSGANELQIGAVTTTAAATVNGFTSGGTVTYAAGGDSTVAVNIGMTGATDPNTDDTLNVALNSDLTVAQPGNQVLLGVDGIENLAITTADRDNKDGATSSTDGTGYGLVLSTDSRVSDITATGDRALSYTATTTAKALNNIDFSGVGARTVVNLDTPVVDSGAVVKAGSEGAYIYGTNENDILTGGAKDDVILGDAGKDTLTGGAGDDYLVGGTGNDTYTGDDGKNTFAVSKLTNVNAATYVMDTITDLDFTNDTLAVTAVAAGIQNVSNNYDTYATLYEALDTAVAGDIGANRAGLFTYKSDTYLFIDGNNNTALNADDTLVKVTGYSGTFATGNMSATAGSTINGTAANDTLVGTAFNDTINGGAGDNSATGSSGDDTIILTAGGNDKVNFGTTQTQNGSDIITDFAVANDTINFNFGDGGLANNAALRGTGVTYEAANVVAGAVNPNANTGFLVNNGADSGDLTVGTQVTDLAQSDANINAGDAFYYLTDNGASTGLFLFQDLNNDGTVDAGEVGLLGTFNVADATTFVAGVFDNFA